MKVKGIADKSLNIDWDKYLIGEPMSEKDIWPSLNEFTVGVSYSGILVTGADGQ